MTLAWLFPWDISVQTFNPCKVKTRISPHFCLHFVALEAFSDLSTLQSRLVYSELQWVLELLQRNIAFWCKTKYGEIWVSVKTACPILQKCNFRVYHVQVFSHIISSLFSYRLYSDYLYFGIANKSAEDFHEKVSESLQLFEGCLTEYTMRSCVYNTTVNNAMPVSVTLPPCRFCLTALQNAGLRRPAY